MGEAEPDGGHLRGGGDDRRGGGALRGPGGADAGQGRHRAALARETSANTALAAANAELSRSKAAVQARYDLAVDAIKTFHTGVSEDFLLKEERFKELRDRLLKSAVGLLRQARRPARQGDGPGLAAGAGGGELRAGRADGEGGPQRGCAGGAPVGAGGAAGAGLRVGGRRARPGPRSAAA